MANISEYLQKIMAARFGRDVRQSIHDSIEAINNEVAADKADVVASKNAAVSAAATANQKASEASASASAAKKSETAASSSASNAAASALTASQKASEASTSASASKASETAASTSASNASASASTASQKASEASASASAAKGSETAASNSASSASASASTASQKASEASASASAAKTSETAASSSASNASASASTASQKASEASTSASAAKKSETAASTSASNASASASTASQKASEASTSEEAAANSAASALADRQEAVRQAEIAKTYAENASAVTGINIATDGIAGIIKGGENHIAEDGTLQITRKTTDTTLSNSYAGGIRINEIIGKSEQKTYTGKNLFDIESALDACSISNIEVTFDENTYKETGTFTIGAIDQTIGQVTEIILSPGNHLVSGNTYYISFYCDQPSPEVKLYIGSEECTISNTELNVFQFTTGNMINFDFDAYNLGDVEVTFTNMMISASADTTYEKYVGGIPSPNPDYPQEIKSVVVGGIKSVGKNLLDCSGLTERTAYGVTFTPVYENGLLQYINVNGTNSSGATARYTIANRKMGLSLEDDTVLIANGCPSGGSTSSFFFLVHDNLKGGVKDIGNGASFKYYNADSYWLAIDIMSGVTMNNVKFYPMIRLASIDDSTYEPYQSSTVTLSTPITLRGIGDTKDRIARKDGVWGVERNLEETNGENFVISDGMYFNKPINNGKEKSVALCNKFKDGGAAYYDGKMCCVFNNMIRLRNDLWNPNKDKTLDDVGTDDLNIIYQLATPTFEPLPTADQIALNSLLSFDTVTYISTDSEIAPVIDLEYGTSRVGALALENENDTAILKRNVTYKFGVENGIPYIEEI